MFMFFWMVTSMAAIYYDIYVQNFTWSTLYGDLFFNYSRDRRLHFSGISFSHYISSE